MENYYEILQVSRNATEEEIKKAYARLLRKHNPEKDQENFKKIREAYETLSNAEKRKSYDFMLEYGDEFMKTFQEAAELASQKKYEPAKNKLKKLLAIKPDAVIVWITLALLCLEEGNHSQAVEILHKAINAVGNLAILYHLLGVVHVKMNDYSKAEQYLKHALSIEKNFNTYRELYHVYLFSGQFVKASQVIDEMSKLEYDDFMKIDYTLLIIKHNILTHANIRECDSKISRYVDELIRTGKEKEEMKGYIIKGLLDDFLSLSAAVGTAGVSARTSWIVLYIKDSLFSYK